MGGPQKKGVGKGVVIALIVLVVVLGVSNVYVYSSLQGQINALNTDKTNLQNQVNSLNTTLNSLNTTYQDYKADYSHNNTEYNFLRDIVTLQRSSVLVDGITVSQGASDYTIIGYWSPNFAGVYQVYVDSSTANTYVEVIYDSLGPWGYHVEYDGKITVGESGTACFPVLPCYGGKGVTVRVGNTNWFTGATEIVTIVYIY